MIYTPWAPHVAPFDSCAHASLLVDIFCHVAQKFPLIEIIGCRSRTWIYEFELRFRFGFGFGALDLDIGMGLGLGLIVYLYLSLNMS